MSKREREKENEKAQAEAGLRALGLPPSATKLAIIRRVLEIQNMRASAPLRVVSVQPIPTTSEGGVPTLIPLENSGHAVIV